MNRAGSKKAFVAVATLLMAVAITALPTSAARADAGGPSISVKANGSVTASGVPVVVIGKLTPAGATPRVVLQQQLPDGRWRDYRAAMVDPGTGDFHFTIWAKKVGNHAFRVRSNGGSVVSRTLPLKVVPLVQSWPAVPAH